MHVLKRSALVPYPARQMFELVNDVKSYPFFLPWCSKSEIISVNEKQIVASIEINWKGIKKTFTTKNTLTIDEKIQIELVDGPLKRLDGIWYFQPLNAQASKVLLDLEFEFTGNFIDKLFEPVFQHIANTFVDSFCKRAKELYEGK